MLELISDKQVDTNDYESELEIKDFKISDTALKQDILAVLAFLCNENKSITALKQFCEDYYEFYLKEKGSLRQFFNEWGKVNQFNQGSTEQVNSQYVTSDNFKYPNTLPILKGELTADLFLNVLLKNGYLSLDPGAGVLHGKWAHTIQIYILEEARKKGLLTLNCPSICDFVKKISQIKSDTFSFNLWDLIFDSFEDQVFTCPNNVTSILSHNFFTSAAAQHLANKFSNYKLKVEKYEEQTKIYGSFGEKKYPVTKSEAYIQYKNQCALLWFAPKLKQNQVPTAPAAPLPAQETTTNSTSIK